MVDYIKNNHRNNCYSFYCCVFFKIFIHRSIFMPLLVTKIIEKSPYKLVRFCFGLKYK